jgi:hypothetical protein
MIPCGASRCISASERKRLSQPCGNAGTFGPGWASVSCYTELCSRITQFKRDRVSVQRDTLESR